MGRAMGSRFDIDTSRGQCAVGMGRLTPAGTEPVSSLLFTRFNTSKAPIPLHVCAWYNKHAHHTHMGTMHAHAQCQSRVCTRITSNDGTEQQPCKACARHPAPSSHAHVCLSPFGEALVRLCGGVAQDVIGGGDGMNLTSGMVPVRSLK